MLYRSCFRSTDACEVMVPLTLVALLSPGPGFALLVAPIVDWSAASAAVASLVATCCPTGVTAGLRLSVIRFRSPGGASACWLVPMTRTSPFGGSTVLMHVCFEHIGICTELFALAWCQCCRLPWPGPGSKSLLGYARISVDWVTKCLRHLTLFLLLCSFGISVLSGNALLCPFHGSYSSLPTVLAVR